MLKRTVGDFQIDPKAVGTYFEFFVAAQLRRIRLQENFSDIAVPKLIAATVKVGIIKDGDEAITCDKFQIQKFGVPQKAHFGVAMWIGAFSLPIGVEDYGFYVPPRGRRREAGGIERAKERSSEGRGGSCFGGRGEPFAHGLVFVP